MMQRTDASTVEGEEENDFLRELFNNDDIKDFTVERNAPSAIVYWNEPLKRALIQHDRLGRLLAPMVRWRTLMQWNDEWIVDARERSRTSAEAQEGDVYDDGVFGVSLQFEKGTGKLEFTFVSPETKSASVYVLVFASAEKDSMSGNEGEDEEIVDVFFHQMVSLSPTPENRFVRTLVLDDLVFQDLPHFAQIAVSDPIPGVILSVTITMEQLQQVRKLIIAQPTKEVVPPQPARPFPFPALTTRPVTGWAKPAQETIESIAEGMVEDFKWTIQREDNDVFLIVNKPITPTEENTQMETWLVLETPQIPDPIVIAVSLQRRVRLWSGRQKLAPELFAEATVL